jgi:site-specific recombinase XerD
MLYGCGLRVSEPLNLRIKDINLEQRRFYIRGAKCGNDRVVSLPARLTAELVEQMQVARAVWQRDKQNKTPLALPHPFSDEVSRFRWWRRRELNPRP